MFQRPMPVTLAAEERVVLSLRRHGIMLFWRCLPPCVLLLVPLLIMVWALLTRNSNPAQASALIAVSLKALLLLVLPVLVWVGLAAYDWGNDSFHVTTQRVIRSEQYLWISRSMMSARLEQIQNVAVEIPDPLASWLNYGTVVIETAAQGGKIEFDSIYDPHCVQQMIFDLRGIPLPPEAPPVRPRTPRDFLVAIFPFAPQIKPDGSVVYHKHWYVMLRAVSLPALLIMATLIAGAALRWLLPMLALLVLAPALLYQYLNWVNDVYILTSNRIIDIMRIPLVREDRREALLEQIQNVTVNIPSFSAKMLDMGDVYVETAGKAENFLFKTVEHPTSVAEEINRRLDDLRGNRRQAERIARHHEIEQVLTEIMQTQQQDAPAPAPAPDAPAVPAPAEDATPPAAPVAAEDVAPQAALAEGAAPPAAPVGEAPPSTAT